MTYKKQFAVIIGLIIAIALLSAISFKSFGQANANPTVYQFGGRPSGCLYVPETIEGTLLMKVVRNGSVWLTLFDNNKTYKVRVVDTLKTGSVKEGQKLVFSGVYRITSNDWKKCNQKSK